MGTRLYLARRECSAGGQPRAMEFGNEAGFCFRNRVDGAPVLAYYCLVRMNDENEDLEPRFALLNR